jgi:hypothetical protein
MMELQEQIERMSREKEKVVKEKSVMKTEISELYAQIEILQSEKVSIKKVRGVSLLTLSCANKRFIRLWLSSALGGLFVFVSPCSLPISCRKGDLFFF